MVNREEIWWAYKLLLGREPESESAYQHHSQHTDLESLRNSVMRSEEGMACLQRKMREAIGALSFDYFRPVTVFIHIQKTGGTAVHEWLCEAAEPAAPSEAHTAYLPSFTIAELNQLDLISGHFTFQEAMAIPSGSKRVLCCFRDPFARLLSLYRFLRAHPVDPNVSELIKLAQTLNVEDFFAHEEVRASSEVDNRYLRTFCDGGATGLESHCAARRSALRLAIERVSKVDAVFIAEQMSISASFVAQKFGYKRWPDPRRVHVTDELYHSGRFSRPAPIVITSRLRQLVAPLIEQDVHIYSHALTMLGT